MKSLLYFSRLYIEFFSAHSSRHCTISRHFHFDIFHFSFYNLQNFVVICFVIENVCMCVIECGCCVFFRNASFDILKYWNWWTAIIDGMGDCTKEDSSENMYADDTKRHIHSYTLTQHPRTSMPTCVRYVPSPSAFDCMSFINDHQSSEILIAFKNEDSEFEGDFKNVTPL